MPELSRLRLTAEAIGAHYGRILGQSLALPVERFDVPGLSALHFVVQVSMEGGILSSTWIDPVAKGMAQLLLDHPVQVSAEQHRKGGGQGALC